MCGTMMWRTTKQPRLSAVIQLLWRFSLFNHIALMSDKTGAKKILTTFPLGELEETTRTPSYYVDEDYPVRPEIQKPLPEWSN